MPYDATFGFIPDPSGPYTRLPAITEGSTSSVSLENLWELGTTEPPTSDGSILKPFARSTGGVKYANLTTIANPDWDLI